MRIVLLFVFALSLLSPPISLAEEGVEKEKIKSLKEYIATHPTAVPTQVGGKLSAGADGQQQILNDGPPSPISASTGFVMLRALGICIGVLLVFTWLLQRISGKGKSGKEKLLKIIDRIPIGAKANLLLVEIEGQRVCLAVGSDNVSQIGVRAVSVATDSFDNTLREICSTEERSLK